MQGLLAPAHGTGLLAPPCQLRALVCYNNNCANDTQTENKIELVVEQGGKLRESEEKRQSYAARRALVTMERDRWCGGVLL